MTKIKNIIFDLGNVLFDIDPLLTYQAFDKMGIKDFKNHFALMKMDKVFEDLETGKISETDFLNQIKSTYKLTINNNQIIAAWNALLLGFRKNSLSFLKKIALNYNLYLLSNTNSFHLLAVNNILQKEIGDYNLDSYFTKSYYSHIIGKRKPNLDIYNFVLKDAAINAQETLFIDDLKLNTDAASTLKIITHQLLPDQKIEDLNYFTSS